MRVCYLTPEYPPGRSGGIGTSVLQRARGLVAAGHQVRVVGPGPDRHEDDHGVEVRFAPVAHPPKLGWLVARRALRARLRQAVTEDGFEVVVAPDWTGLSAGIDPGCPVVVECNGSATYFADELGERVRPSVRLAERRAVRGADLVTSVSAHVAARTAALFGLDHEVPVVPNAIDPSAFPEAEAGTRDPDLVLHVGTIVRKKGALDLAGAFTRLAAARPASRLRVVGPDAPDRRTGAASTRALAADLLSPAAAGRTTWAGPVAWDEVGRTLAGAAVLLVPSHAEAQPFAWLEAMATGLPVVGYDHPWAREVVEHGRSGLLVPPGDVAGLAEAVRSLLDDDATRASMGHAAATRVRRHFAIEALVPRLLDHYGRAARGTSAARP